MSISRVDFYVYVCMYVHPRYHRSRNSRVATVSQSRPGRCSPNFLSSAQLLNEPHRSPPPTHPHPPNGVLFAKGTKGHTYGPDCGMRRWGFGITMRTMAFIIRSFDRYPWINRPVMHWPAANNNINCRLIYGPAGEGESSRGGWGGWSEGCSRCPGWSQLRPADPSRSDKGPNEHPWPNRNLTSV